MYNVDIYIYIRRRRFIDSPRVVLVQNSGSHGRSQDVDVQGLFDGISYCTKAHKMDPSNQHYLLDSSAELAKV